MCLYQLKTFIYAYEDSLQALGHFPRHALHQCTWQHNHSHHLHFKVRHICTNTHSCHLVFLVSLTPTHWFPDCMSDTYKVCVRWEKATTACVNAC